MRRTEQGGFSLLEVVVAMAIMGFAFAALYESAGNSVLSITAAEQRLQAVSLAESVLAPIRSVTPSGVQGSGENGLGYAWHLQSTPLPPPEAAPEAVKLHMLTVVVRWGGHDQDRTLQLATVVPERAAEP